MDQMQIIFDVIGSPTQQEIEKMTGEKARSYVRNLPQCKKKNLWRIFPGCRKDDAALDLFTQLLKFDVGKRMTVEQALEHPYLRAVRFGLQERCRKPVTFNFEFESAQLGQKQLRELILEEVIKYNKLDEERFIQSGAMPNYKRMKKKKKKKAKYLAKKQRQQQKPQ